MRFNKASSKHALLGLAALAVTLATGCGDETPADVESMVQEELGIPVSAWFYKGDSCVYRQGKVLLEEINDLEDDQQAALSQKLKQRHAGLILNATEIGGRITGALITVHYTGPGSAIKRTINELKIDSSRRPGTRVENVQQGDRQPELAITPVSSEDRSVRLVYSTEDASLFRQLKPGNAAAALDAAVHAGKAALESRKTVPLLNCGKVAHVGDFK